VARRDDDRRRVLLQREHGDVRAPGRARSVVDGVTRPGTRRQMTISLAEGGAGLGTVWGIQTARRMLADAGFSSVEVLDSPRPQNCIYVCQP
jgi:hypothetical protein